MKSMRVVRFVCVTLLFVSFCAFSTRFDCTSVLIFSETQNSGGRVTRNFSLSQAAAIDLIARDPDRVAGVRDILADLSPRDKVVKRIEVQRLLEEGSPLPPNIAKNLQEQFQSRILSDVSYNIVMTSQMDHYHNPDRLIEVAVDGMKNPSLSRFFDNHSLDLLEILYDAPYFADSLLAPSQNDLAVSFDELTFVKNRQEFFLLKLIQKAGQRYAFYVFTPNALKFASPTFKSHYSSGSNWLRFEHLNFNWLGREFRLMGLSELGSVESQDWGEIFKTSEYGLDYHLYTHNFLHDKSWKRKKS
jgi:hypothetical protein